MYFTKNANTVQSAVSGDGLTFSTEEGLRIERGSVSSTLLMPDGKYVMYFQGSYNSKPAGYEATSSDGLRFTPGRKPIVCGGERGASDAWGAESPSVTVLPRGGYFLIYVSAPL
jgi:hypothetical protein